MSSKKKPTAEDFLALARKIHATLPGRKDARLEEKQVVSLSFQVYGGVRFDETLCTPHLTVWLDRTGEAAENEGVATASWLLERMAGVYTSEHRFDSERQVIASGTFEGLPISVRMTPEIAGRLAALAVAPCPAGAA